MYSTLMLTDLCLISMTDQISNFKSFLNMCLWANVVRVVCLRWEVVYAESNGKIIFYEHDDFLSICVHLFAITPTETIFDTAKEVVSRSISNPQLRVRQFGVHNWPSRNVLYELNWCFGKCKIVSSTKLFLTKFWEGQLSTTPNWPYTIKVTPRVYVFATAFKYLWYA